MRPHEEAEAGHVVTESPVPPTTGAASEGATATVSHSAWISIPSIAYQGHQDTTTAGVGLQDAATGDGRESKPTADKPEELQGDGGRDAASPVREVSPLTEPDEGDAQSVFAYEAPREMDSTLPDTVSTSSTDSEGLRTDNSTLERLRSGFV